jgi:hypothetical protein
MGFLLTDFVQNIIEDGNGSVVFRLGMQYAQGNPLPNAAVVGVHVMDVFGEHESGPPGASVVFGVGEHVTDVHLLSVVMDGRYQPELVASDVKDCEPAHLIGRGERDPQTGEGGIVGLPNNGEPVIQWSPCIRMCPSELHQPLSRDDVHLAMVSQYEIFVKRAREWFLVRLSGEGGGRLRHRRSGRIVKRLS